MNRRSFLQSVIAVPLVAVGMPRTQAPLLGQGAYPNLRAAMAASSGRPLLSLSELDAYVKQILDDAKV